MNSNRPNLQEITWMRGAAICVVVMLHVLGYAVAVVPGGGGDPFLPMASVAFLRFARQIFMVITGFVLTYQYWERPVEPGSFWTRRAESILVPYVTWSFIYLAVMPALGADTGIPLWHLPAVLEALLTGSAMYHLYYVVLTLQFYLLFPWWIRWFQSMSGRRRWIWTALLAGLEFGILYADFRWSLHYTSSSKLFLYRDRFLGYYFIYFLFGSVIAAIVLRTGLHRRLRSRSLLVGWLAAGATAVYVVTTFVLRLRAGWSYVNAINVMQPSYAIYGMTVALALYFTGRWKRERGGREGWLYAVGRCSFGIYLSHPLILFLLEQNLFTTSNHRWWWAETAVLWSLTLFLSWLLITWADRVPVLGWMLGSGQKAPWHHPPVHSGGPLSP